HPGAATLRDEIGGTIYDRALQATLDVALRPLLFLLDSNHAPSGHNYFDDIRTPAVETREQVLLGALQSALDHGARVFGTDDVSRWRWGDAHAAAITNTWGGAFDLARVAVGGGIGSVNVAEPPLTSKETNGTPPDALDVVHGPNLRMVVTFAADGKPSAEVVLPGGQSGVP